MASAILAPRSPASPFADRLKAQEISLVMFAFCQLLQYSLDCSQ